MNEEDQHKKQIYRYILAVYLEETILNFLYLAELALCVYTNIVGFVGLDCRLVGWMVGMEIQNGMVRLWYRITVYYTVIK